MRPIGFSTGALARGDFLTGIEWQRRSGISAIELSALREDELDPLLEALPTLDLRQFKFRSFHAPSQLNKLQDAELVSKLLPAAQAGFLIVVHPDIIRDFRPWHQLGENMLIENMDQRKAFCRTASEMSYFLDQFPKARFCFDIGHARQVDPTMSVAVEFILRYRSRLAEIHISEVNWQCRHIAISSATAIGFHRIARLLPNDTPVIVESMVEHAEIDKELATVHSCLSPRDSGSSLSSLCRPLSLQCAR